MSNIRKILTFTTFFAIALAFMVLSSRPVQAQTNAPGVWSSSINLQNVSTSTATVVITFYNSSGGVVTTYTPSALAAGQALSIFVPAITTNPALPSGQYSVVVSSDVQILASVNTASTSSTSAPWTAFAYDGFDSSQAGSTLYFPGNYNNYFNFFSELVIQNTDASTTATLRGTFRNQSGAVLASNVNLGTVAPNASRTVAMSSVAGLPSGNSAVFSAVITSDQAVNLVGVANIWRTSPTNGTASYSGFTGGSSTLYPPALYNNYFGFRSALTVQNVGTGNAVGTVTYSNGTSVNFNLVAGAAVEYFQPANTSLPSGNANGIFSAKVTTTQGTVVGLVSLSSATGGPFASYNVPSSATSSVNIPNLLSDYYGYFSAVTVQNAGTTNCPTLTIAYANGSPSKTASNIPAGGTHNFIHLDNAGDTLPFRTTTSATVTCSNGNPLVAVIQHNTSPNVAGYNSAKTPSDYLLAVTGVSD